MHKSPLQTARLNGQGRLFRLPLTATVLGPGGGAFKLKMLSPIRATVIWLFSRFPLFPIWFRYDVLIKMIIKWWIEIHKRHRL